MSQARIGSHASQRHQSLCARGGGGSLRRLIVGVAALGVGLLAPAASGQGFEELRVRYPDVKAYHPHGRVLTVWGTAMTRGETPREAAEEWVFWHGDVFGSAGGLDLEEFRDVKLRRAPKGKERRVFMYRQTMDIEGRAEPLPVVGSSFRVMTEGDPESGPAAVVYVAGRVATRPAGGLSAPRVTAAEALAAAKAHERGRGLEVWSEPELVAIYDDAPRGDGVAYPTWRVSGINERGMVSWRFYIDALTGAVVRDHSNVAHVADEIQGNVSGNATPGTEPDTFAGTSQACPNDPISFDLRDVRVTAFDANEVLVDSGWTDAAGDYSLDVTPSASVNVFAELKGPGWFVLDGSSDDWGDPIAPLAHAGNPVTAPTSGVDLEFNATPTEKWTAFVNTHLRMSETWRWLDLESIDPISDAPVIVHRDGSCGAHFALPGEENPWPQGALRFRSSASSCANAAYSTIVAHEYAHYVLHHLAGIEYGDNESFHEGFSDTLGLLVFDTEFQGEHFWGCDEHIRWPRQTSPPIFHTYPMCGETSTCSMGAVFDGDPHCIGELLGALWRDMHDEFEEDTRDLFLDWMMIAQVPGCEDCEEPFQFCFPQSADAGTLVEVLQVAGNQKAPAICYIFGQRQIFHPPPTPNPCQESAGRFCYADCDGSAFLDFFDFLCFQNAFATSELYADCDSDSELSFFDFLCFQNEYVAGCL